MVNYANMYKEFDDQRLLELSKNVYTALRNGSKVVAESERPDVALRGMYATEELKSRGYENTVQDLIAEIADQEGLFTNG